MPKLFQTRRIQNKQRPDQFLIRSREVALEKDDAGISTFVKVNPIVFTLSEDAHSVLIDFQRRNARRAHYEDAAKAAAMHKAGRIAARLCLILHCVRSIEEAGYLLWGLDEVSKETAENAVVLADWFIHESERVYAMLHGEPVADELTYEQRKVMLVLERKRKPMTSNEIRNGSNPTKKFIAEQIDATLMELKKLGKVDSRERQHEGGKGRPTTEWFIPEIF